MVSGWRVAVAVGCLGAALVLKGDAVAGRLVPPRLGSAPAVMLWAWEEPEDLRGLDARRSGVAFLAERVFLVRDAVAVPRQQRILVPEGVWAEAVVRFEAERGFQDSAVLREQTARAVLRVAALSGVRGVQVDFDATQSQRSFYTDVLRRVRAGLPKGEGLSMTALVSWCSVEDGWMRGLPVDAAVPMYFQMGKHVGWWSVREPLCEGSVGVATDEPWMGGEMRSGQRVYVFAPRPWTAEQLALVNRGRFPTEQRGQ